MRTIAILLFILPTAAFAQDDEGYEVVQRADMATRRWAFAGAEKKTPEVAMSAFTLVFVQVEKAVEVRVRDPLPGWKIQRTVTDGGDLRLELVPLGPGERPANFTVQYRTANSEWMNADFPPITIRVTTKTNDDDPSDITGPDAMPSTPADLSSLYLLAGMLAAAGIGYFVYRWVMTPRSRRSSADLALHSLARLKALKLPEKNRAERHFAMLSRIARRYIDRAYSLSSRRQTTAEFLATARATPALQPHVEFLTNFLEACDLAKFAPPQAIIASETPPNPKLGRQLERDLESWLLTREG